jgi:alkanesulfonate monooxygenase SsuD/methylene tetrahydromethanopterin reductase-like flavin-dependent oxidoreductase (luciferase family)
VTDKKISFGLVLPPTGTGREWVEAVRKVEQQGWTSLLIPDTLWTPAPFQALAAAAALTTRLRLRTWVIAAPLRSPTVVAREASTLQLLSDGRFELGIGTGRPDAEREAELLGVPWGTAGQRIGQVQQVIAAVREKVRPTPQIVVTAAGPRMLAAAAESADRIGLALPPAATERELRAAVDRVRSLAPGPLGLSLQVTGLAGRLPDWLRRIGLDPQVLTDAGAVGMLTGDARQMAGTVRRLHDEFGIDEIIVPGELADDFAPVISLVAG